MKKTNLKRNIPALIALFSSVFTIASCGNESKVESKVKDQQILLETYEVLDNHVHLNIKSTYDIHSITYEYTLFDKNKKLLGSFEEAQDISLKKNSTFNLVSKNEVPSETSLVRLRVKDAKTYDTVDSTSVIDGKVFFYDYLEIYNAEFKISFTEKVSPKQFPKVQFALPNIGAYTFSKWSYDLYGNDVYSYDTVATTNLLVYPNYSFKEDSFITILKNDNCIYSAVEINSVYYNTSVADEDALTTKGYGFIHKSYLDDYYIITAASLLENKEGYSQKTSLVRIKDTDYSYTVFKVFNDENIAVLKFTAPSTKYGVAVLGNTSYLNIKVNTLGIIEPPYNKKTSRYVRGTYVGHEQVEDKQLFKYSCELGENLLGCPIFNYQGNIIGMNIGMYKDGSGYAIPIEVIRECLARD